MRVAEGNVGDGDVGADLRPGFGHVEGVVGEGRAADLAERLVADHETAADAEAVADFGEGALLAGFGALSVGDVQGGDTVGSLLADGQRGADGGVHASGEGDYGLDGVGMCVVIETSIQNP